MSSPVASNVASTTIRLGLLTQFQVNEAWQELESRTATPEAFLKAMERKGYLTPYQSGKLLKGDADGYFMGGYRILYKIASGSFGRVYRAEDPASGRTVAIKVLRKKWTEKEHNKIEQFMREAKVGMSLRHENIVEIITVSHEPKTNQYFMVMEFVEGGNLKDLLTIRKKLNAADVLRIMQETAAALAHALSKGITHRDMKLTNILLSSQGPAKLVDFGLAGEAGGEDKDEVSIDRTVDYAGLEKVTGVPEGDTRSDLFFLGCVAYELLTGQTPLEHSRSQVTRMSAQRFQKIVALRPADVQGPPALVQIINNLMALNANQRIQTPSQLLDRLREVQQGLASPQKQGGTAIKKVAATIFLVESDEQLQNVLRTKLKEEGYRILIAGDPLRALERFRQQPFDLLVVDCATTGENGYYVFEQILDESRRKEIPCRGILMLSMDQVVWKERMAENSSAVTLIQPIKYKQLLNSIQSALPH